MSVWNRETGWRYRIAVAFAGGLLFTAGLCTGQTTQTWKGVTGDFGDAANWNGGVPGAVDVAGFHSNSTYTVTLDAPVTNDRCRIFAGSVTFDLAGNDYTATNGITGGTTTSNNLAFLVAGNSLTVVNTGGSPRRYLSDAAYATSDRRSRIDNGADLTVDGQYTGAGFGQLIAATAGTVITITNGAEIAGIEGITLGHADARVIVTGTDSAARFGGTEGVHTFGTVEIRDGGLWEKTGSSKYSSCAVTVDNAVWTNGNTVTLGQDDGSVCSLLITNGGRGYMQVSPRLGYGLNAIATIRVTGSSSSPSSLVLNRLYASGATAAYNGSTRIYIEPYGRIDVSTDAAQVWPNAEVELSGGTLGVGQGPLLIRGANGTLRGWGIVQKLGAGTLTVTNSGVVAPGVGPACGTLTLTNANYVQDGGSLQIQLGGDGEGEYDRLDVRGASAGNVTILGGTLDVSLVGGYTPSGGEVFDILDWGGSLSGTFTATNLPTVERGEWAATNLYVNGQITFIKTASPGTVFSFH